MLGSCILINALINSVLYFWSALWNGTVNSIIYET